MDFIIKPQFKDLDDEELQKLINFVVKERSRREGIKTIHRLFRG